MIYNNAEMEITKKQKKVLEKIYEFMADNSYPPTVRDIARMFDFASPRAAYDHLKSLEKKGFIKRNSLARSLKLTGRARDLIDSSKAIMARDAGRIPLLGKIAAGDPILAEENIEDYIYLPDDLLGAYGADFALRVRGNSMTGDHILDGDIIMVKSQHNASNGEIIAALIDEEAAVKRFYRTGDGIELRSSNPAYPPIKIPDRGSGSGYFKILGKVVAVHRNI